MKKYIRILLVAMFTSVVVFAQQPQTQLAPISPLNAKYANGTAPGYWPTAGSGLTLNVSGGTAFCGGAVVQYTASTLTMTASTTNYVYLNTSASCVPAVKTSTFVAADIPVATVTTSGSTITAITDVRTLFQQGSSGSGITLTTTGTSGAATYSGGTLNIPQYSSSGGGAGGIPYVVTTGAVNAMVATFSPAITSLMTGLTILILPNLANTIVNPTLNVNGLGAKNVTIAGNTFSINNFGNLSTTIPALLIYNGTSWDLQNPAIQFTAPSGGSAATPAYSFPQAGGYGIFLGAGSVHIAVAGADAFGCTAGQCTVNGYIQPQHYLNDSSLTGGNCLFAQSAPAWFATAPGPCVTSTNGGIALSNAQTTVSCSTSGNVVFSQPAQGSSYKQVMIYSNACSGTASYTFPTAFSHTPQVLSQSLAAIAGTPSTTAVTITGLPSTGFLELDGF